MTLVLLRAFYDMQPPHCSLPIAVPAMSKRCLCLSGRSQCDPVEPVSQELTRLHLRRLLSQYSKEGCLKCIFGCMHIPKTGAAYAENHRSMALDASLERLAR